MSAERWLRLRELYDALSHVSPAERERLLNELCVDPDLRTEVLALLAADEKPDPFLTRTARRSAPLRPGAVLCDRFVIHRLLGKGGMGEVWAARYRQLKEDVAIKTIRPTHVNEAGGIARFKREIQLARRIAHPNVCRVHELFEDATATPPRLFLTMELLEGQTLSERLFEDGPLSSDAALEIVRQIAAGLAAAHEAGVVHRDLKPSNIMITAGATSFHPRRFSARVRSDSRTVPTAPVEGGAGGAVAVEMVTGLLSSLGQGFPVENVLDEVIGFLRRRLGDPVGRVPLGEDGVDDRAPER